MKYEYVPKIVREGNWKGSVTVEHMTFDQRTALVEKVDAFNAENSGEKTTSQWLKFAKMCMEETRPMIASVNLVTPRGQKAASYDDLLAGGKIGHDILQEIALGHLYGFEETSGNSPAPSDSK